VLETELAKIWAQVLGGERVGVNDNFFHLGGDSISASRIISRVRETTQVELSILGLFESPTVVALAERIEETRRKEQGLHTLPMLAVSREKPLPLSFAQQRLWFLDQYEPNGSVYNIPSALRLRGTLDIGALEQSLSEIIRRHESLRTTFSMVDGEPIQVIAPSVEFSLAVVDLTDHPVREEETQRLVHEEARRPFDLAQGPLFRNKLVRLGEDDHVLLLTMHHIVSDGWSMGVLYRELSVLYEAFSHEQPSPLPDLPIQYADFAIWQRNWLQGEVLESQLSYWKNQLDGVPAVLNLPTDRPRPAVQSFRGERRSFELSKEIAQRLKVLSRQHGVTLFMTLLAAFQTLLHCYTGRDDIVVGSPIANRNRIEIEGLVGFFVNTLVLRSDLSGNPTFRELLDRVRKVTWEAFNHQDLPFDKLMEVLNPKRDRTYNPLVQIAFAFQNVPREPLQMAKLAVSPTLTDPGAAKTDLTLFMWEAEETLAGSLNYASDLFDAGTVGRMLDHFQTLLEAVVANPERRLLDLAPFLEQTRSEVLEAIHRATEQSWHFGRDATAGREQGEV
jgi:acyl carrier protein